MATLPATTFADKVGYKPIEQISPRFNTANANDASVIRELAYKAFVVASEAKYDGSTGIFVEAWLPETLATDINANYESPMAQGLNGMMPGLGAIARFAGMNLTTQALTAQIWQGGGHIQFSLPFVFQAETSAAAEVMEPIKQLFTLTLPKDTADSGGGLLQAPGPHFDYKQLWDSAPELRKLITEGSITEGVMSDTGATATSTNTSFGALKSAADKVAQTTSAALVAALKGNISLYIGQFMYFPSVIIKDVNPTFDVILDQDKNPMRATVNVNFETFYVPTSYDLNNMFPATAGLRAFKDMKGQGGR